MKPLVSIVVPTTGKEPALSKCLEALRNSLYDNIEIIIVNEGRERSYQRNFGIKRAKGDYILYLDSDQYVTPELIGECVSLTKWGRTTIYIPERIITKGFFGYLRNWERQFYTSTPIDCVRFFKREGCPLFDETLNGPEDADHDRRVKGARATTMNYLEHEDNVTLISFLKKKAYYSKSMARYEDKNPNDKCLNWWWRCFGVFFEKGKWKKVIQRPDLYILVMILILTRGIIYLKNK